ncbi:MAG: hypothetical protein JRD04_02205 [Deltaproteobacteria bacterium]|nr:hypothetical protein [Deltaproteobacteria bacterium]
MAEGEQFDSECFELPAFLEGLTARSQSGFEYAPLKPGYYKIMEPAFSYMVLGWYPAQGNTQLISREWLRADSGAMLPPDELLIEELTTPTYEVTNGKVRVMKKDVMRDLLKRSPDRADALCLTFAPSSNFFDNCEMLDYPIKRPPG